MGADRAVVLRDAELGQADASVRAEILAAMIAREEFDIVFCGKQSVDTDTHQVGPAVAEKLGFPAVTFITTFALDGTTATVSREAEGVTETLEIGLPALFTCTKGLNEPRYPSLPGIMQAARKPKEILSLADLNLSPDAKVKVLGLASPPPRAEGRVLKGEMNEQVSELVRLLRDEAHAV
jgi:electron transfer flavoprotein beta subunit